MSKNDVRAALQQAKANDLGMKIMSFQSIFIALVAGVRMHSLGIGFATLAVVLLVSVIVSKFEKVYIVVSIVFGIAWAVSAAMLFSAASEAAQAAAIFLGFTLGAGGNILAFRNMHDLQQK